MSIRSTLLAAALLLATLSALPAADAADPCLVKPLGPVCAYREGACASVVWQIAIDFAAGAGSCPDVSVGSESVHACEFLWGGFGGLAGFQGVIVDVCAVQDDSGGVCVTPYAQVFNAETALDPLCLA